MNEHQRKIYLKAKKDRQKLVCKDTQTYEILALISKKKLKRVKLARFCLATQVQKSDSPIA
jgi:hypothetical protein